MTYEKMERLAIICNRLASMTLCGFIAWAIGNQHGYAYGFASFILLNAADSIDTRLYRISERFAKQDELRQLELQKEMLRGIKSFTAVETTKPGDVFRTYEQEETQ